MDHVAIDLGGKKSQVCVRSSDGKIVRQERVRTSELKVYVKSLPQSVVTLETCAEAFAVADAARGAGHQVRVVPASLVKSLGVGSHGIKNDKKDAQHLSAASCRMADELPTVHIPTQASRDRKAALGMRDVLVSSRTRHINAVRGWLRAEARELRSGGTESFCTRVRELASQAHLELPSYVALQLQVIEHLNEAIAQADQEVSQIAKSDPRCGRLMTIPGVGPVVSLMFVAVIDDEKRFSSAAHVASYLGLAPGEDSSSERSQRTSITKAGSASMRRLLVQAAHIMRRYRPDDPLVQWSRQIEGRRLKRIAIVALARKIAAIAWAMLRDNKDYEASRAARAPAPSQSGPSLTEALRSAATR